MLTIHEGINKVEINEEELDNVEQNQLDPSFSNENIKLEHFSEDFSHENINSDHKDLKPWRCDQCDKRFPRLFDLKRHIKSVHEGIKYKKMTN